MLSSKRHHLVHVRHAFNKEKYFSPREMSEKQNGGKEELVSFEEKSLPPSRERHPTSRGSNSTSRASNPPSRQSRESNPSSREGRLFAQQRKRSQSVYSQHLSIKPLNTQSIIEAQKKISLNPAYMCKKFDNIELVDKVRLTKACHRPVTVPLVKIIGRIPEYVDVSELQGLRSEVESHKIMLFIILC